MLKEEIIKIIKEYIKKGERYMNQFIDDSKGDLYAYWDGFHKCAENILKEIKDIK